MATGCNIGPSQRRRRLWIGVPLLLLGSLASWLTVSWWPWLLVFVGWLGVFQASAGTCVALAARGTAHMDTAAQPLASKTEIDFFRKRARGIYARSLIATLALLLISRVWLLMARAE